MSGVRCPGDWGPLYADDLLLPSPSAEGLQRNLSTLHRYTTTWAFPINMDTSKVMVFQIKKSNLNKSIFTISKIILEQVQRNLLFWFKQYLHLANSTLQLKI